MISFDKYEQVEFRNKSFGSIKIRFFKFVNRLSGLDDRSRTCIILSRRVDRDTFFRRLEVTPEFMRDRRALWAHLKEDFREGFNKACKAKGIICERG